MVWSSIEPQRHVLCASLQVYPLCFLDISTSLFPPVKPLQLNATSIYRTLSSGSVHTFPSRKKKKKKDVDLLSIKPCQKESLFRHSSAPFAFPPLIGTCFLSTCTPNRSQRILFPFLRGGDRMLKMDKPSSFWKNLPPYTCMHIHTPSLCGISST